MLPARRLPRHAGISKVRGSFNTVSGSAVVSESFTDYKIDVTVDLASINTRDENRDGEEFTLVGDKVKIEIDASFVLPGDAA